MPPKIKNACLFHKIFLPYTANVRSFLYMLFFNAFAVRIFKTAFRKLRIAFRKSPFQNTLYPLYLCSVSGVSVLVYQLLVYQLLVYQFISG